LHEVAWRQARNYVRPHSALRRRVRIEALIRRSNPTETLTRNTPASGTQITDDIWPADRNGAKPTTAPPRKRAL